MQEEKILKVENSISIEQLEERLELSEIAESDCSKCPITVNF